MRVLVLSLSDVDPIADGVLYCCDVQGERRSGSVLQHLGRQHAAPAISKGNAVPASAATAAASARRAADSRRRWCRRRRDRRPSGEQHGQQPGPSARAMRRQHRRRQRRRHRRRQCRRRPRPRRRPTRCCRVAAAVRRSLPAPGSSGAQVLPASRRRAGRGRRRERTAPATADRRCRRGAAGCAGAAGGARRAADRASTGDGGRGCAHGAADSPPTRRRKAVPTAVPPTKAPRIDPEPRRAATPTAASGVVRLSDRRRRSAAPVLGLGLLFADAAPASRSPAPSAP